MQRGGPRDQAAGDPPEGRVSLGEAAYRRVRDDILACRLAPGQRVTERGLALELGASIGAVREALTRLDHEGLVRTLPRKGYLVTPLTMKSVNDLYDVWRLIGPELTRLGIRRATAEQTRRMRALMLAASDYTHQSGSPDEDKNFRLETGMGFFVVLAEATGNEYLISAYRRISGDLSRVAALLLDQEWADIADLVADGPRTDRMLAGDADGAAEDVSQFIEKARDRTLRILSQWPSVVSSEIRPLHPVNASDDRLR